ncbi:MAG: hypothetical protein LC122_06650 [Chitinophagales bacterium]|nr:hypothetical protein [Chitinophagales bacterium]
MFKYHFYIAFSFLFLFSSNQIFAQKISYSNPERDDPRSTSFDIIGRFGNNYLIYKNYRNNYSVSVYDAQMKLVEKNKLEFLPDKILGANFLTYPNFSYMFYQYQKRGVMYSMAVKLDATGKKISEPIQLDTTSMSYTPNNIYTILYSENKQKIMSLKVNNKSSKEHILKTVLFDKDLNLISESFVTIPIPEKHGFLQSFQLDNDGNLVFLRSIGNTSQTNNINKLTLMIKFATSENIVENEIKTNNLFFDDISIKIDNYHKTYLVSSFFSKQRRGNIDGLFCYMWDKEKGKPIMNNTGIFNDDLRVEAKGSSSIKAAFNDYFLRNIIFKQDGGFIVVAESVYTSSRGGGMNSRWDYWNNSPYWGAGGGFYSYDYMYRYGSPYYPWGSYYNYNNITRYYADNILIISYDSTSQIEWSNVISKSQYDDDTDNFLGYSLLNTGSDIRFLFNVQERRNWVLNEQTLSGEGQITRSPTLKGLENNYEFMPRYAKQVGAKQIIVPCLYRGYVCFAKIDLQ